MNSLSNEEEELLYLMKKSNFINQISNTELSMLHINNYKPLKRKKSRYEKNKEKLISQVGVISERIKKEKSKEEKKKEQYLYDILYRNPQNENKANSFEKKRMLFNQNCRSQSFVRKKLLPKLNYPDISQRNNLGNILNSKKEVLLYSNNDEYNYYNGPEKKNKKLYYIIGANKPKLPPINKFKLNIPKLRLNVNNQVNLSDQKHEDMMRMYKELEYKNKFRFIL